MVKNRYFLFAVSFFIVVIVGLVIPHHWVWVYYGLVAFVIGSVALTEEWKTKKRLKAVLFVISIAIGGLLTTKGWNVLDNHEQKKALIQAVVNELIMNDFALPCTNLPFDPNNEKLGEIHFMYPTFKSSTLNELITSSLFTLDNAADRKLILQIMRYETHISNFNRLLRDIDWECTRKGANQESRRKKYHEVSMSPLYQNYSNSHKATKKFLHKNYTWAFSERVGKYLEKFMKRNVLLEDPNTVNNPAASVSKCTYSESTISLH
jgi:hypothetical protein